MRRELARPDLEIRDLSESRSESVHELGLELLVDLLAGECVLYVSAYSLVEEERIGDPVGVYAGAAEVYFAVKIDSLVDYSEGDRVRRAEFVVHYLFGVEIIDSLVSAGLSAVCEALADLLEGVCHGVCQVSGEDAGLAGSIISEFAGFGADVDHFALVDYYHALSVRHNDAGSVGDDVVIPLSVGRP